MPVRRVKPIQPWLQQFARRGTIASALALSLVACAPDPTENAATQTSSCSLQTGPCALTIFGQPAELILSPRPLPMLTPIEVQLTAPTPLDRVRVSLEGRDMDMGPNETILRPNGPLWTGRLVIPICATGPMHWQLRVKVSRGADTDEWAFDLSSPGQ